MQFYGPSTTSGDFQPGFMYSQCNGRKKALLVGINYTGTDNQLSGCINDANNVKKFIQSEPQLRAKLPSSLAERSVRSPGHYHYQDDDTVMLTDDRSRRPEEQPTRANILRGMQWLVRNAQPNDSLFFHCKIVPPVASYTF